MDNMNREWHKGRSRREISDIRLLVIIGAGFFVGGVALVFIGTYAVGLMGIAFGATSIAAGRAKFLGEHTRKGRRSLKISGLLFTLTSLLLLVVSMVAQEPGSSREINGGVFVGLIGVIFFGGGSLLIAVHDTRQCQDGSSSNDDD
ncbi:hypothetical protein ACR9WD_11100 [Glutamicibacter sp. PAEs-4]|uniref:hypothetical protein n=1 Tax=Glutamicibacter sp. PAEs-4 TaxID=3444114 RepID=UPI003EB85C0F